MTPSLMLLFPYAHIRVLLTSIWSCECELVLKMQIMGKEKMERKLKKRDIDNVYPKWSWVDYRFQDAKFFEEVRKLPAKGLDPKG